MQNKQNCHFHKDLGHFDQFSTMRTHSGVELKEITKNCRFGALFLGSVDTRRLGIGLGVGRGMSRNL